MAPCVDDVVQSANVHQRQGWPELRGQCLVCRARLGVPARMVVRNDDRRRVEPKRLLDDLTRMHLGGVDRAVEHLHVVDQSMACVEEQHRERSEEHTSELQSLMRISYAVFCLKKKKQK